MSLAKFLDGTATADPEVTQAILDLKAEIDAKVGGPPMEVVKPSELAVALENMGYAPGQLLILGLTG